jgi:uncharacterized protein (TIGR02453 family)
VAFSGFPPSAIAFYEELTADNTRAFWQANKARYEADVKGPMLALLEELSEFGPFSIFRPYNDVRFSKNKAPYKLNIGALGETEGGAIDYVQFSAEGLMAGSGYYHMASDQLERFRAAVDAQRTGKQVERLVADLEKSGYAIGAIDELKTAPRGYPKDHPRIVLIRRKGLIAYKSWPVAKWMHTKAAAQRVREMWLAGRPLDEWLDQHVGPSTLPPPDFGR